MSMQTDVKSAQLGASESVGYRTRLRGILITSSATGVVDIKDGNGGNTVFGFNAVAAGNVYVAIPGEGAAVGDPCGHEARRDGVVQQVMDDAVAELGGPDFARLRPGDDEADGAAGAVGAGAQFVVEAAEVALEILLEIDRAGAVALALAAINVGLHEFGKSELGRGVLGSICGRHGPGLRTPCRCCSGCRC